MKKYLICAIFSALLLYPGTSAGAVNAAVTLTGEQVLQSIPVDLQQRAKSGSRLTEEPKLENSSFTLHWGKNDGTNYILEIRSPGQDAGKCGVFDFAANKWRIPCTYDNIYLIPNHRYFLVMQGEEKSTCYEAEADGTVHPEPLPIDGIVSGVDEQGYVTLCRTFEVELGYSSNPDIKKSKYCLLALLDNHYQMVLDYVVGRQRPGMIGFSDGVALIETGGSGFYATLMETCWAGATEGFINRKGEWLGKHDYINTSCYEQDGNLRIWGDRGDGKIYWIVEDGGEVELKLRYSQDHSELRDVSSDWARDAIAQAASRGLIPKKLQGYYTLDTYREELCSLLINLYRTLGRQVPPLDTAPVFTDCEREDVRLAAALGIVSAHEDGTIFPRSRITRQEAAEMLYRFMSLFRTPGTPAPVKYPDDAEIDPQLKAHVYAIQRSGIMNGLPDGHFAPNDYYTIEQSIFTANRLFDLLSAK